MEKMLIALSLIFILFTYWLVVRIAVSRRLFNPDRNWCTPAQADEPRFVEKQIKTSDGQMRTVWYSAGKKGKPAILYLHGNFYSVATFAFIFRPFLDAGFPVCIAEYRGFDKTGGRPSEQGLNIDAHAAYDFLKSAGHKNIVIHGCSLGTSVAARLASDLESAGTPPFALILESPFYSLLAMCPKLPLLRLFLGHKFATNKYVKNIKSPKVLLMHGVMDSLVGVDQGTRLFGEITADKKLLHLIPTGRHELFAAGSLEYAVKWLSKK